MDNVLLTAEAILAIPVSEPGRLFSGDPEALKREWHALAARWHPDARLGDHKATEVLQHINALRASALRRLAAGVWEESGLLRLKASDGRSFELRFRRKGTFELGEFYIGASILAYALPLMERDLFEAAVHAISRLRYPDAEMQAEIAPSLPEIEAIVETADRLVLVLRRRSDLLLLADLLGYVGGRLDPRHVAWIVGALENLACYLDWGGLMHGAIGPASVFVSPKAHSVALLGGWWYAVSLGSALRALPERTLRIVPPAVAAGRAAANAIDLELIRLTAREALGDPGGSRLLRDPTVPAAFSRWLMDPPRAGAFDDYRSWEEARAASFGARRFIELPIDPDAIYRPI
ncbi:MAG: molecular chaperone DnaJ [Methylobacteriaceae bacterium]|nr:molecular chaperone DnaJ [Methylobacteriaceae bacterium]